MIESFDQSNRSRLQSVLTMATASMRADRSRSIASMALDVAVGASGPFMAVGVGMLVDASSRRSGRAMALAVAVTAISSGALLGLSLVADRVRLRLEENVAHHVEVEVTGMVTGLPGVAHHENPAHLHRVDRLLEESWLIAMAVPALVEGLGVMARFGLTVALLARVDGRLALLPLAMLPTIWAGVMAERIRLRAIEKRAEAGRLGDDIFRLVGLPANGGELRAYGVGEKLIERHAAALDVVATDERNHRLRGSWRIAIGRIVFTGGFALALLAIAQRATRGDISLGQLVAVIGLSSQVIGQAGSVSGTLNWLNWALTGVRHYVWLLDYDRSHRGAGAGTRPPERLLDGVRFEYVSFAYPGTDRLVLDRFDLFLPAGSVVAVVGDNGVGKTTIVKLLLRFYEPTSGRITVDGVPLDAIDADEWRLAATATLQDHTHPELLVGETIGIGDLPRLDDPLAISGAAVRSGADAVAADLPGGFGAQLGVEWPGGTELSGGQWQRLAVGRSSMRTRPLLMVLDEPTASLDPAAEHALFEQYARAADALRRERGAITVVISHRLSTVRLADVIVVLEGSRITEMGSHDELLARDGLYARLFRLQASAYE
jgi:ATP-binding cassette subfamily B protein